MKENYSCVGEPIVLVLPAILAYLYLKVKPPHGSEHYKRHSPYISVR